MVNSINQPKQLSTTRKKVNYAKWGYIFILPFFVIYAIFSLWPLLQTFYYSFFQYYRKGLEWVGPNFVGIANYQTVLMRDDFFKYLGNTLILWVLCFVPQIVVSLLLAVWFTDRRLKLKGQRFFKTVTYMPNLIMASAFGFLFLTLLSPSGPVINMLLDAGILSEAFDITADQWGTRLVIALMNFLMWFGNTTLLLMSGVMGIDEDIFEAATVDGAGAFKTFKDITMTLLKPIFVYVFITSMIGGIQLYDAAAMFTRNQGGTKESSYTLMMYLSATFRKSTNYGKAGAISILLFIMTAALSIIIYYVSYKDAAPKKRKKVKIDAK